MPFAPIAKPWDLLDDPHLKASGGLLETLYMGKRSHIPALPIELDGKRLPKRSDPPEVGEHGPGLLRELGYSQAEIAGFVERRIVAFPQTAP
jgi:crotonobetainyl-CoA:carnitine CoA-transferase CaiB-like acyl-CoA transferase